MKRDKRSSTMAPHDVPWWWCHGIEFTFAVMPPGAPLPVVCQGRLKLGHPGGATNRTTEWFGLSPSLARGLAASLLDAATRAEQPHLPGNPSGMKQ